MAANLTKLTGAKKVVRETLTTIQGRKIIVTIDSHFIRLRPKGRVYSYDISIEGLFMLAAEKEARRKMIERKKAREEARKARKGMRVR